MVRESPEFTLPVADFFRRVSWMQTRSASPIQPETTPTQIDDKLESTTPQVSSQDLRPTLRPTMARPTGAASMRQPVRTFFAQVSWRGPQSTS